MDLEDPIYKAMMSAAANVHGGERRVLSVWGWVGVDVCVWVWVSEYVCVCMCVYVCM